MNKAAIFNLDGVLAESADRTPEVSRIASAPTGSVAPRYADGSVIDFAALGLVRKILSFASNQGHRIHVMTNREEKWRYHTMLWMRENCLKYDSIYMRPNGNDQSELSLKQKMIAEIAVSDRPEFGIDMNMESGKLWRKVGLVVLYLQSDIGEIFERRLDNSSSTKTEKSQTLHLLDKELNLAA